MRKLFVLATAVVALALAGTAAAGVSCEEYGEIETVTLCVQTFDGESGTTTLVTIEVPAFLADLYLIIGGATAGPCPSNGGGEGAVNEPAPEPIIPAREILCLNGQALDLEVGTVVEGATPARFYFGVGATCDDLGGTFTGTFVGATGDAVEARFADLPYIVAYPVFA